MKFQKIPVEVEAMLFRSNNESDDKNMNEICIWINRGKSERDVKDYHAWHNGTDIFIQTLEGIMRAQCGDWIIRGVQGEFYPCKPDIFKKTYKLI